MWGLAMLNRRMPVALPVLASMGAPNSYGDGLRGVYLVPPGLDVNCAASVVNPRDHNSRQLLALGA